jgi:hypothetical protein
MNNKKYFIALFCNKKRVKIFYRASKRTTIYEYWRELKTQKKPPFIKVQGRKRHEQLVYELALVFPMNRWVKEDKTYIRDSIGRIIEAKIDDDKFRIKEIIPYWEEERIYDFNKKKRIRYHQVIEQILEIKDIAQVFTLNNKLFVQIDNDVFLFGNKNINDANRLFEVIREDITKRKRGNFLFVKDVTTHQRKILYNILESKGFKRSELFRHYSY